MKLVSDFVLELIKEWKVGDAPINILIGDRYYEITDFYFDEKICEYILKIEGGIDYQTRADTIVWKVIE